MFSLGRISACAHLHLHLSLFAQNRGNFLFCEFFFDIEKGTDLFHGLVAQEDCDAGARDIEERSDVKIVGRKDNFLEMLPRERFDPDGIPDGHNIRQSIHSQRSRKGLQGGILVLFKLLDHLDEGLLADVEVNANCIVRLKQNLNKLALSTAFGTQGHRESVVVDKCDRHLEEVCASFQKFPKLG